MEERTIRVTGGGRGMTEALSATEQLGEENGLTRKEQLHLRLLAEELFGMLRSIAGETEAEYLVKAEGKSFELRLRSKVEMTEEIRRQLLSASTSGENAAARGFMGRLRVMIAEALLPGETGGALLSGLSLGFMSMAGTGQGAGAEAAVWSLRKYRSEVSDSRSASPEAEAAWDELEKSIVANIADEISVRILGSEAEIIVYKAF